MAILFLILSGAVSGMTYAVFEIPILIYLSLIPFFYIIFKKAENTGVFKMYLHGLAFFYPYFIAVFHWFIYQYPLDFLGFSKAMSIGYIILAWFGVSLLMTVLFSFIPVFMRIYVLFKGKAFLSPLYISCIWCIAEWLNSKTCMGVPWARLAVTQQNALFYLQSSSILSSFFISFIIVFFSSSIAYAVICFKESDRKKALISSACAVFLIFANAVGGIALYYSDLSKESGDIITVSVLQGNMLSGEKWEGDSSYTAMQIYLDMIYKESEKNSPDIMVLPETAIPVNLNYFTSYREMLARASAETESTLLVGAFNNTDDGTSLNSIFMFTPDGGMSETVYNKQQLVPFGEFLPMRPLLEKILPMLSDINATSSDLAAGDDSTVFDTEYGKIGSLICFDSIFELLSQKSVENGAELLCISTNDSWFSDSAAIYEHNGHARLRAIENRRYIMRSANSGMSSAITPRGEIIAKIDPLDKGTLCCDVVLRNDVTFFSRNPRLFPSFLIITAVCLLSLPFAERCIRSYKKNPLSKKEKM